MPTIQFPLQMTIDMPRINKEQIYFRDRGFYTISFIELHINPILLHVINNSVNIWNIIDINTIKTFAFNRLI